MTASVLHLVIYLAPPNLPRGFFFLSSRTLVLISPSIYFPDGRTSHVLVSVGAFGLCPVVPRSAAECRVERAASVDTLDYPSIAGMCGCRSPSEPASKSPCPTPT